MDNLRIRTYQPGDEQAVISLWFECKLVVAHNNPKRDIERKLAADPNGFLVGELNGAVVATCMAGYDGHRGWINYLAVSPKLQRQGIATCLLKEIETRLRAMGCPKINLQIRETNTEVIRFYEQLGYSIDRVVSMGKRLEVDSP